jgi:hypothetical protein
MAGLGTAPKNGQPLAAEGPLLDGRVKIREAPLIEDHAAFLQEGSTSSYLSYGLRISSELALPELTLADGAADVTIRFGRVDILQAQAPVNGLLWAEEDEACLSFERIGSFLVRQGREIVVDPAPGEDERWVRNAVMGPVMGTLLYQRGWLTLHASSTAVNGMAVAFMADRGWGKSTMAAAMVTSGHHLIADDITAIKTNGSGPVVSPGYPLLKLWPEAAASVKEDPATLPEIAPGAYKRSLHVRRKLSSAPLSLGCIYVLDQGNALEIESLRPQEALTELIRNTYGRELLQAVRPASHFQQCADVVNSVPIRRLRRPYSLGALFDVVRVVEEDLVQVADKVRP